VFLGELDVRRNERQAASLGDVARVTEVGAFGRGFEKRRADAVAQSYDKKKAQDKKYASVFAPGRLDSRGHVFADVSLLWNINVDLQWNIIRYDNAACLIARGDGLAARGACQLEGQSI
jgi:hypothetical protein